MHFFLHLEKVNCTDDAAWFWFGLVWCRIAQPSLPGVLLVKKVIDFDAAREKREKV